MFFGHPAGGACESLGRPGRASQMRSMTLVRSPSRSTQPLPRSHSSSTLTRNTLEPLGQNSCSCNTQTSCMDPYSRGGRMLQTCPSALAPHAWTSSTNTTMGKTLFSAVRHGRDDFVTRAMLDSAAVAGHWSAEAAAEQLKTQRSVLQRKRHTSIQLGTDRLSMQPQLPPPRSYPRHRRAAAADCAVSGSTFSLNPSIDAEVGLLPRPTGARHFPARASNSTITFQNGFVSAHALTDQLHSVHASRLHAGESARETAPSAVWRPDEAVHTHPRAPVRATPLETAVREHMRWDPDGNAARTREALDLRAAQGRSRGATKRVSLLDKVVFGRHTHDPRIAADALQKAEAALDARRGEEELLRTINTAEFAFNDPGWRKVSEEALDLVGQLLQRDPRFSRTYAGPAPRAHHRRAPSSRADHRDGTLQATNILHSKARKCVK